MQILAATDFSIRSHQALRRAGLLARSLGASLALVHVLDESSSGNSFEMDRRQAGRMLMEQIGVLPELRDVDCSHHVVRGSAASGIMGVARTVDAGLIVLGAHRRRHLLKDIFVGTTAERVIRHGRIPFLVVHGDPGHPYDRVLIPVESSKPSRRALRFAVASEMIDLSRATLLHAFVAIGKVKWCAAGGNIDRYEDGERQAALDELAAFLAAGDFGERSWNLRAEEGLPVEVIMRVAKQKSPDLIVMGTHARSGLLKALMGSVTELVLRSVKADVLVVPPGR